MVEDKDSRNNNFTFRLTDDERGKAIALSEEREISLSELFRSVLYRKIPKTPSEVKVKTLLKLGEVGNEIDKLMVDIPVEKQKKFKELKELLAELGDEIELCP
ncbi:hypothetical protein A5482_015615 (plasmid) [Cyanobacterium sp. IPPAS B-1200]|uniref:hypothetical protein n=1 Tax=Cyanobacterium sp. IPPAS B-1200 TaxID=1562720 RepID=UPI0008524A11|nr:hypothetical protein [Cyanobacterium sp. IPPAS B-1200]OEJ78412.1 hypothetical protein A5482_13265 [Cyanobacterium sp. IPPAS B-1200]